MPSRKAPQSSTQQQLALFKQGLVLCEVNLLKHPFNLLSKQNIDQLLQEAAKRKESHIRYEDEVTPDEKRLWEVNPNIKVGYTRPFDKKVLVTVLHLVMTECLERDVPPPAIWKLGSLNRLCEAMQLSKGSGNRQLIKESLVRISQTGIYTETFWLKEEQDYWREQPESRGGSFTLWSVFWKNDRLPDGNTADSIYLAFNVPFILSLQAYYVKPIDYDYWLQLPPLAQRLYELTGLKFYGLQNSPYARFEYDELAQLMPVTRQQYFSKAKNIFERAGGPHAKLKDSGWLSDVEWKGGQHDRPWVIRYYPGWRAERELAEARERLERFQRWQERHFPSTDPETEAQLQVIVQDIEQFTNDTHSRGFYRKVAKNLPYDVIWRFMSEIKADHIHGPLGVNTSVPALFNDKVKRYCRDRDLDIGVNFTD